MEVKDIQCLIEHMHEPFVINNVLDWDLLKWDLNRWKEAFKDENLTFRMGKVHHTQEPQWENTTEIISGNFEKFLNFNSKSNWLYFDYKHLCSWLLSVKDLQKEVNWSKFGFPDKNFKDSTIWIGTKGAHTPCHVDSYGCNLIAQIYGRKRWLLFPPNADLKATRIPYEESSIYSQINFYSPSKETLKDVANCRMVILEPGQVLFVPNGWWHYVENLETAISVNVWLDSNQDYDKHIDEAITLILIKSLTSCLQEEQRRDIININEDVEGLSLTKALDLLNNQISREVHKPAISNIGSVNIKPNFVKLLNVLSKNEFNTFIEFQANRFTDYQTLVRNSKEVDLKMFIDVLTDTDVINLIKSKLFEKLN